VFDAKRFTQKRIVPQIDLSDREIIGGTPPRIDSREFFGG
jgi:hypothetical protein